MRVYIYTHDPILHLCYTKTEAEDLFGDCDEDLVEIPDRLVKANRKAYQQVCQTAKQIENLHNKNRKENP